MTLVDPAGVAGVRAQPGRVRPAAAAALVQRLRKEARDSDARRATGIAAPGLEYHEDVLTLSAQCAVMLAERESINRDTLAGAMGISRRTLDNMMRPSAAHAVSTRAYFALMSEDGPLPEVVREQALSVVAKEFGFRLERVAEDDIEDYATDALTVNAAAGQLASEVVASLDPSSAGGTRVTPDEMQRIGDRADEVRRVAVPLANLND